MTVEIKNAAEIAELTKTEEVSLWYANGILYPDYNSPEDARWIGDLDKNESAEFIEDFTRSILKFLEEEGE